MCPSVGRSVGWLVGWLVGYSACPYACVHLCGGADYLFWAGDLNYRLEPGATDVRKQLRSNPASGRRNATISVRTVGGVSGACQKCWWGVGVSVVDGVRVVPGIRPK